MTGSLYVLGAPGVGKTTLCRGLLENVSLATSSRKIHGVLVGHDFPGGVYLGKMREEFPGTDALAMSVGPDAIEWVTTGQLPDIIFGEGARLGYAGFLNALARATDLTVVHLTAKEATLDARCRARGSNQGATWRKGAATRAASAVKRVQGARIIEVQTDGLQAIHVLRIVRSQLPPSLAALNHGHL